MTEPVQNSNNLLSVWGLKAKSKLRKAVIMHNKYKKKLCLSSKKMGIILYKNPFENFKK